ncbi:putative gag-polypeptide of LTR copia-type [Lupinus albus]|uniref:Putative gag-polypeptide of LTR copia-type n=1 Tax=Lupinus albus TaxID=3870 RepID=A0A6A4QBR2_LUPAL|nr:putative gag-polypeptide of LTR copia-type [Lupinus albus]
MNPNENPGAVLVTPPLTGSNYHSWSREMMMTLKYKNKLKFIDDTLHKPNINDPSFNSWDRCNTLILAWINHSIDKSILQSILWMDTALEVW